MVVSAVFIFLNASGDVSTYANFDDATKRVGKVKVSGVLDRDKEVIYDPAVDPNYCKFHMIDSEGISQEVILTQPKPQDFERSEQVVVTGKMNDDIFLASEVLTKCPSKYKEDELYLRSEG